ncbi:MAG: type II secretion system F family protein [Actinobacteria bacterium]|nr:type II secretion system F family protein [Actinomycetota bacterium]
MNAAAAGALVGLLAVASALTVRAAAADGRRGVVVQRLPTAAMAHVVTARASFVGVRPPPWLARRLAAGGLDHDARRVWAAWVAVVVLAVGASVLLAGPGLAVVVAAALAVGPAAGLALASGRAERLLEEALPEALEAVARGLRSGASLVQSIGEAGLATSGRLGHELAAISAEVARGGALVGAIDAWGDRHAAGSVRLAVSALGLGAETGGAHARALDGVAATIRSRLAVSREVRALSSQARLSGAVITVAPLAFAVLAAATDERTAGFLLRTPLGLVCLGLGLCLDGLAALWMHRLVMVEP